MIESDDNTLNGLLEAIRKNPDDDTPRLALADWIDEHMPDEHALAELYRGGAKKWLENMCAECRGSDDEYEGDDGEEAEDGEEADEDYEDEYAWFTYDEVLRMAKDAIENNEPGFHVGNVMSAQDFLYDNMEMFWVCIEVVLGMKVPDNFKTDSGFGCAC